MGMLRDDAKASFFRKQAARGLSDEYLASDTTYADTGKIPMFHMNRSISSCLY
jgi:hypothetical protein